MPYFVANFGDTQMVQGYAKPRDLDGLDAWADCPPGPGEVIAGDDTQAPPALILPVAAPADNSKWLWLVGGFLLARMLR